jgi:hypothetical protein
VDSTLGIHPTREVDFSPLHPQNLTRLNIGSFLLSLNHACSGLLRFDHDQNHAAVIQLPFGLCPDSSPDSGPPTSLGSPSLLEAFSLELSSPGSAFLLRAFLSLELSSPLSLPLLGEFIRGAHFSSEHGSPMRPAIFCASELLPSL